MNTPRIFNQAVAERLEAVYRTPEIVAQRRATLQAVAPRPGERILDSEPARAYSCSTSPR